MYGSSDTFGLVRELHVCRVKKGWAVGIRRCPYTCTLHLYKVSTGKCVGKLILRRADSARDFNTFRIPFH